MTTKEQEKIEREQEKISPRLTIIGIEVLHKEKTKETFRDILIDKLEAQDTISDNELFDLFYQQLYSNIDKDEFIVSAPGKKKGISISKEKDAKKLNIHSAKNVIEGVVMGGVFGRHRKASQLKNKNLSKEVDKEDVITDSYYVLLYFPMDFNKGYILFQYYPDITIKPELLDFIEKNLKRKSSGYNVNFSYYCNDELTNQFKQESILDHLKFSSTFINDDIGDSSFEDKEQKKGLILKVEASSLSGAPISFDKISSFMKRISSIQCNEKKISNFEEKKAIIKNIKTGKTATFDIDNELKIRPVLYLYKEVDISDEGIPDFEQLKIFCFNKLDKIKTDTLPGYGKAKTF